jgi:hydrogenase maturation protease
VSAKAPILVLGWGNLSRGDDALGPLFVAGLKARLASDLVAQVEFLDDYQLQVEHALDLEGRSHVLFVDASLDCTAPFVATALQARRDTSYTSHALSPQALMQVFEDLQGHSAPPATLLALRGEVFGLGEPLSAIAQGHLQAGLDWGVRWIRHSCEVKPCDKTRIQPL